jgi:hypothetical protein
MNSIGIAMFSVLVLNVVDGGFEPWSGKTKDYTVLSVDIFFISHCG